MRVETVTDQIEAKSVVMSGNYQGFPQLRIDSRQRELDIAQ